VLRPHAFLMKEKRRLTKDGEAVLNAVKIAGYELIKKGRMNKETLEAISRPLVSEEELTGADITMSCEKAFSALPNMTE